MSPESPGTNQSRLPLGSTKIPAGHGLRADTEQSNDDNRVSFRVVVQVVELNANMQPDTQFRARTVEIGSARLVFLSRRMLYEGTSTLVIVPLLDDVPTVLGGKVESCQYDSAGEYRIEIEFSSLVRSRFVDDWMHRKKYRWWNGAFGTSSSTTQSPVKKKRA